MRVFGFDFETAPIGPGQLAPPPVCMAWTDRPGRVEDVELLHARFDRKRVEERLVEALSDRHTVCVGSNVAYDLGVIVVEFPHLLELVFDAYERDGVFCIETAQKLIDIANDEYLVNRRFHNLAGMARRHLGVDLDKDTWRMRYGELLEVQLDLWEPGAALYPRWDGRATFDVCTVQCQKWPEFLVDVYRQSRASWWLHLMMAHGFRTDPVRVDMLRQRVEKEHNDAAFVLRRAGLLRLDGTRDTKAAARRMVEACEARGLDVPMTEGGASGKPQVALDEDACLLAKDEVLKAYAKYSSLNTIFTKDIPALSRPLIQSNFETLVETGRTGCSGGAETKKRKTNTYQYQLQNVRKKMPWDGDQHIGVRECFVPRPGCVLLSVDYGQVELHAWAQVCLRWLGFSELAKLLNNRIDVHMLIGCRVNSYEDFEHAVKHKREEPFAAWRQAGKPINFGFPGGLGWRAFMEFARLQYGVVFSPDEAKRSRSDWMAMIPEGPAYFDFMKRVCGHDRNYGTVTHLFSERVRGGVHFTNACNSPFQGLAADCAKHAGFNIARAMYLTKGSALYGSRLVNFVHDEFIAEVPEDRAHEAAQETVRIMEESGKIWMPEVPPRAEPALMRRWYKKAEPVYDARGRLSPWAPKEERAAA